MIVLERVDEISVVQEGIFGIQLAVRFISGVVEKEVRIVLDDIYSLLGGCEVLVATDD